MIVHVAEVDDHASVDDAVAGGTVAAAAHGQRQCGLAGEADDGPDVTGICDPGDDGRPAVDVRPDASQRVVVRVTRHDEPAADEGLELIDRGGRAHRGLRSLKGR